ncbi:hypothetical protein HII36_43440 [Nonomuraea sp. NN258]|nr:hypothetical protein [Nonomuraea antri]NRQ38632.1 hypothetical protein [Nonomuraea antri]
MREPVTSEMIDRCTRLLEEPDRLGADPGAAAPRTVLEPGEHVVPA